LRQQFKGNESQPEFGATMMNINIAEANEVVYSKIRDKGTEADRMRAEDFATGWNNAFKQYAMDAQNYGQMAGQMFNSVTSNMNSAIDNFVRTGKLAFKDFARSVIQDLIAIELKMQAAGLLRMGLSAIGLGLPGRATGGPVSAGAPYMVGERGPELFVPQNSGSIVPTNRVGSALSGGGQTVNYNGPFIQSMNAIDTQTGVQFLVKNKTAIWAANQSAQRSLPMSK
jgi:phage-related minor tail protein